MLMWNIEELWAGEYTPLLPVCLAQYLFSVCWHHLLLFPAMPVIPCHACEFAREDPVMQIINAADDGELFQWLSLS